MPDAVEQLVESLLYEGYALYPYTPGATKNATPTPFGIVYPPVYAAGLASIFDHLELRCGLLAEGDALLECEVRFLAASGERHRAEERRIALPAATLAELLAAPLEREHVLAGGSAGQLRLGLRLDAQHIDDGTFEVGLLVENRTPCAAGLDRAQALGRSLLSTHPLLRVRGGRFVSPLERPCASRNTFPVLASPDDDVVLGAAIVLPDHPQIASESLGGLFDSTEIEEALLLHVRALSDGERAQIERDGDPVLRDLVERASAAGPGEILGLHGRVTLRDPVTREPPRVPPGLADPTRGERAVRVDGVIFRPGARVRIRPGPGADLHARLAAGRSATVERIFVDDGGRAHLGVTIDGDPGQDLLRETGRLLFFFPPEVEVIDP